MPNVVKKLNSAHEAIAAWLVMNPSANQRECAEALGYTEAWISRVINSDMFQAYYQELRDARDLPGVQSIQDKIAHNTHLVLDRMREKLELPGIGVSEKFLGQSAKTLFAALGYDGSGDVHVHQHDEQHVHLTAEAINAARDRAREVNAKEINVD